MPTSALTQPTETTGITQLILDAPEPVWKKIAQALQVKTRQEAVQIVQVNEDAASLVRQIIATSAKSKTALTDQEAAPRSALTSPVAEEPLAQRLYGGGGKARLSIG